MTSRIKKAADLFASSFETRQRDTGEEFVCLVDGSPDWMRDAIREAHGGRMPCDYLYRACKAAVDHFAETLEESGREMLDDSHDAAFDFAESFVSVYHADRFAWLADHLDNHQLVDQMREEGMVDEEAPISDMVAAGMATQAEAVFERIAEAIEEAAEEMPYPFVAGWNLPGHLPDEEPAGFDTFYEAKQYVIDELKQAEDEAGERGDEETAEDFCHAAEDVNLKSSPFEIIAGPFCFFVMESQA